MVQKIVLILVLSIACSLFSNKGFAGSKVKPMDVINNAPRCYVVSELLTLYVEDNDENLKNFYINYCNAVDIMSTIHDIDDMNSHIVGQMFNELAVKKRKILIKSIMEIGYTPDMYEEVYKQLSCYECSKVIAIEDYLLE